jgi:hypothetical protein
MLLSRLGMGFLGPTGISKLFFPGMVKNDRFACTKYRFNYFELAH